MADNLTQHEDRVADALLSVIDYAGRVLISAGYGSHYQLDKATELRARLDRLVTLLEKQTLSNDRCAAVNAVVARDARRYTLGSILVEAGQLGGTA